MFPMTPYSANYQLASLQPERSAQAQGWNALTYKPLTEAM